MDINILAAHQPKGDSVTYLSAAATPRTTPQSEPIPGSVQVKNSAGGFVWEIGSMERLRRWLILGSESGTYYATEQKLTRENIAAVRDALDEHGPEAVEEIVAISTSGRAPKPDQAIYALAMACAHEDLETKRAAIEDITRVCRTGTHLFMFLDFVQGQRGWGRSLERGVAAWYEREDVDKLAYQLVKYRSRYGWTHRDALRKSHPEAFTKEHAQLFDWVCGRDVRPDSEYVKAFLAAQKSASPRETAALIDLYGNALPREALQTEHAGDALVMEALLRQGMPMTALIRNLGNLTRLGVIKPMSANTRLVVEQLSSAEAIHKARVHPMQILTALATYASGRGFRGTNNWTPVREIVEALDDAFYTAFENVDPSGKRYVLGLDCSHSMDQALSGCPLLTCMQGAAAMAIITERTERQNVCVAFHGSIVPIPLSSRQRLDDVLRSLPRSYGQTDCSLPILWALENNIEADVFALYSDNETWYGNIHPAQALKKYREKMGIDAKLVVTAMTATPFSIADQNDAGMLDCVGFDTTTPQIISEFAAGRI